MCFFQQQGALFSAKFALCTATEGLLQKDAKSDTEGKFLNLKDVAETWVDEVVLFLLLKLCDSLLLPVFYFLPCFYTFDVSYEEGAQFSREFRRSLFMLTLFYLI